MPLEHLPLGPAALCGHPAASHTSKHSQKNLNTLNVFCHAEAYWLSPCVNMHFTVAAAVNFCFTVADAKASCR
jgi:hypothetical protein